QLLGREGGFTGGRDRSFHFGTLDHGIVGMISHLGAMLPVADGLALAGRLRGEHRVVAVFSGDGGTSEGDFHEALNLAAAWRLPPPSPARPWSGRGRRSGPAPPHRGLGASVPGRPRCATSTPSPRVCGKPCGPTSGSCSSARTSPSTAAPSR